VFTGLIQHCGTVGERRDTEQGVLLRIDAAGWSHRPAAGDSIAVCGCCLSVRAGQDPPGIMAFDVVPQTLGCTTLGRLRPGDRVNLEHAVTPQTLMGGHIVQGHIDGVAQVTAIEQAGTEHRVRVQVPEELQPYCATRGSIAIEGVSLTIAAVHGGGLDVALIPTTLQCTTLGQLRVGALVNIEVDYIAKLVVQSVQRSQQQM
jgi:riboflavin synthase